MPPLLPCFAQTFLHALISDGRLDHGYDLVEHGALDREGIGGLRADGAVGRHRVRAAIPTQGTLPMAAQRAAHHATTTGRAAKEAHEWIHLRLRTWRSAVDVKAVLHALPGRLVDHGRVLAFDAPPARIHRLIAGFDKTHVNLIAKHLLHRSPRQFARRASRCAFLARPLDVTPL